MESNLFIWDKSPLALNAARLKSLSVHEEKRWRNETHLWLEHPGTPKSEENSERAWTSGGCRCNFRALLFFSLPLPDAWNDNDRHKRGRMEVKLAVHAWWRHGCNFEIGLFSLACMEVFPLLRISAELSADNRPSSSCLCLDLNRSIREYEI